MANSKGKNNKKVIDYGAKREKKIKEFILIPVTSNDEIPSGFIKKVKHFGKEYYYCKNNVSSL